MKLRWRPLLKTILGTGVALVLLEAIIRICFPAPIDLMQLNGFIESERGKFARYDSLLGWDGLENASGDFQWIDTRHHVQQNRYGYRGAAYGLPRSKKRRLLVLGDSYVWGFGVENAQIFTSLMEQRTDHDLEVINAGVSGYGNDQEYLLWRKKHQLWEPDEVLLVITPYTDIVDNLFANRYGYPKPHFTLAETGELQLTNVPVPRRPDFADTTRMKADVQPTSPWNALLAHSDLVKMLIDAAARFKGPRAALETAGLMPRRLPGYDWERPLYLRTPTRQVQLAWQITDGILEMLADAVQAENERLVVVIVPSIVQVYPDLWAQFCGGPSPAGDTTLDPEMPNKHLQQWCRQRGIPLVDLLPDFRQAGRGNPYLYFPFNRHWTAAGHRLVAERLLQAMAITPYR